MKKKSNQCPREGCSNHARKHLSLGILPCLECQKEDRSTSLADQPEFATQTQTNRVQGERDKNAKDMLQPWIGKDQTPSKDFVDAYPDKAEDYFSKDQLKKL